MNATESMEAVRQAFAGVAPEADLSTVDGTARWREELDIDSLDFLNLIEALHDLTGVDVPEQDYPQVVTMDGLVGYLVARTATQVA